MRLSIRYDLGFQEALLRYTDDQVELWDGSATPNGTDRVEPTLEQEQTANASYMALCDMIDLYTEKRLRDQKPRG